MNWIGKLQNSFSSKIKVKSIVINFAVPIPGSKVAKKEFVENQDSIKEAGNDSQKENQSQINKPKKSVKFSKQDIDDDGKTWENDEIKKLETKCVELIVENEGYKTKLQ